MTTGSSFNSASAFLVLEQACARAGLTATGAKLIRLGENAIYSIDSVGAIVRIARDSSHLSDAAKEVRVSQWLTECSINAARLLDVDQPVMVDGHPVTFWEQIADSGRKASAAELGSALRAVHECKVPESVALPHLDIFRRVDARLQKATTIQPEDIDFLRRRFAELRATYSGLQFNGPPVALHGDAHVQNLICPPSGDPVLIDFEGFCQGPREVDLTVTATEYDIGWHSAADYASFCQEYGMDVRNWEGYATLRDIQLLKMTTWLMQNVGEGNGEAEEFERRLSTLKQSSESPQWQPF